MWKKLSGLGMLGVAAYVLHVVLGGFLWKGYDHLNQAISDLTGSDAPNKDLLIVITLVYAVLCIVFVFSAYMYTRKAVPKIMSAGLLVFLAMHLVSSTYNLFPVDLAGTPMSALGFMHIVVTVLIVPLTILAPILTGVGLLRVEGMRGFGKFSIAVGIFIFFAGGASAVFAAQQLPYFGLVERLNIGSLQLWTFLLSMKLFSSKFTLPEKK